MHEAILVEEGVLVGEVQRSGPHEGRDQRRLAAEGRAGRHDRAAAVDGHAGVDGDPVRSVLGDVEVELGLEHAERQLQVGARSVALVRAHHAISGLAFAREHEAIFGRARCARRGLGWKQGGSGLEQTRVRSAQHGPHAVHLKGSLECPCPGNQLAHARIVHARLIAATGPPIRRYDPDMQAAVLGVRLLLAVVFLAAGIGKLRSHRVSAHTLVEFGVPPRLTHTIAIALPHAELSTAVALVLQPSARWGAVAAVTLLLTFSAAVANALAHHRRPDCSCFGQIHSAPVGVGTLARNATLLVLAIFICVRGPGPGIGGWVSSRTATELVLGLVVVVVLALAVGAGDYWLNRRADKRGWPALTSSRCAPDSPSARGPRSLSCVVPVALD